PHIELPHSRREFLERAGGGFASLALYSMLVGDGVIPRSAAAGEAVNGGSPLSARKPHYPALAKSVIFLFMDGGPSHIDTLDPKPMVNEYAGKPLPPSVERVMTPMGVADNALLACQRTWKQYGESGLPVSNWYPHVGECIDDIAVIRSCWANGLNHVGSVC